MKPDSDNLKFADPGLSNTCMPKLKISNDKVLTEITNVVNRQIPTESAAIPQETIEQDNKVTPVVELRRSNRIRKPVEKLDL